MNTLITRSTLATAIALSVVACGPGGGSLAGIGGSGYVSSGSVSGFGSVFVNGVEFETDSATFDVDGVISNEQTKLAIGMVVKVNGSINEDGITGTATEISYDDELQGPVSGLVPLDPDPAAENLTRSFSVLGVNVIADRNTIFDISDNGTAIGPFDFENIANDNNIEISGFHDSNGNILATRIELKDNVFDANSIVEVRGVIANYDGIKFDLGNPGALTVNENGAPLDDLPNGVVDGVLVEVKGTFDTTTKTLNATKIEGENNIPDDIDEFEVEGYITNFDGNNMFNIGDIRVDISNITPIFAVANDLHVEVEGAVVNSILIANEFELEDGNIKVYAEVTAVPPVTAQNTFEVKPSGQSIIINVSTDTQIETDLVEDKFFNIDKLKAGDFVEVQGFDDGIGGVTATEVGVKSPGDVIVQGPLQSFTPDISIQVLGITFDVEYILGGGGETKFENTSDIEITQIEFIAEAPVGTLVKIKDVNGTGISGTADEIDIESP